MSAEIESFLYSEAALLDDGRYEEWLALYTDDCRYHVPIGDPGDELEPSLIDDDRQRLGERVARLLSGLSPAQVPMARTIHNVTNVVVGAASGHETEVHCNLTVHELRVGGLGQAGLGTPQTFAGRAEYLLRGSVDLSIVTKRVFLLGRDMPLTNISIIL